MLPAIIRLGRKPATLVFGPIGALDMSLEFHGGVYAQDTPQRRVWGHRRACLARRLGHGARPFAFRVIPRARSLVGPCWRAFEPALVQVRDEVSRLK